MSKNTKLINELRECLAQEFSKRLVDAMPTMSAALFDVATNTGDADIKRMILGARDVFESRSRDWQEATRLDYIKRFNEKISGDEDQATKAMSFSIDSLKLVDDEEMREEIMLGNVSERLREACGYELFQLSKRVEALAEVTHMTDRQNPVLPQLFCRALLTGLGVAGANVSQRCEILAAGANAIIEVLNAALKEGNEVLVSRGFMIEILVVYGKPINRAISHVPPSPAAGSGEAARGGGRGSNSPPSLPDLFARLLARLPSVDSASTAAPTVVGSAKVTLDATLLEALERFSASVAVPAAPAMSADTTNAVADIAAATGDATVAPASEKTQPLPPVDRADYDAPTEQLIAVAAVPKPVLNNLVRQAALALGPTMLPAQTVITEVVANVFDQIFAAPNIPGTMKVLIGKLQLPIFKAALQEPQIFTKPDHPIRRFVDELADVGVKRQQSLSLGDPVYERVSIIVNNLHQNFDVDPHAIERANHQLLAFIQAEENSAQSVIVESVVQVQQQEEVEMGESMAAFEVDRRFAGKIYLRKIKEFARTHWQTVLAKDYLLDGEDGEQWKVDLVTLDELLWSISPADAAMDRQKLLKLLPTLLGRLNAGLDRIGVSRELREPYFQVMVNVHSSLLRPTKAKSNGQAEVSDELEAQPNATVSDPRAKLRKRTTTIERGQWIEMTDVDGTVQRCRLSWVSPLKETFVLKNYDTKEAVTLTAEKFQMLEREGRIKIIEEQSLTERSIQGAMMGMLT
ncbi:MAG: DUF1631 family protein [Betaproteobacteria bacterium]|jgi:hypothetical protein